MVNLCLNLKRLIMKFNYLFVTLLLSFSTLFSFAQEEESRTLPAFDRVKVSNQINVLMEEGPEHEARIVATGIALENVILKVADNTLEIYLDRGVYKDAQVDVYVTYVHLYEIFVNSSGRVSLQTLLKGYNLAVTAFANGEVNAQVDMGNVEVKSKGGGVVRLSGVANSVDAQVSGGGNLSALDLKCNSATVKASSGSIVKMNIVESIQAKITTGASLTLDGNPKTQNIKKTLWGKLLHQ